MSATLRYEVGLSLYYHMLEVCPAWQMLSFRQFIRSAAGGAREWNGMSFSLKLPSQVSVVHHVWSACAGLANRGGAVSRSARILYRKLTLSLGLPHLAVIHKSEEPFVSAVNDSPNDLVNWAVYADWLTDQAAESYAEKAAWFSMRADVIRAWLDPKVAAPVRNGVITLAQPKEK